MVWTASSSGTYSLKSTSAFLMGQQLRVPWQNLVWESPVIPRMKFNLWLTVQSKLPTLDSKSMAQHENICVLCRAQPETHDHLFFNCCFVSPLWRFIKQRAHFYSSITNWDDLIHFTSNQWKKNTASNLIRKICFSSIVYHTWEERNERIFRGKKASQRLVLTRICNTIIYILKLGCLQKLHASNRILCEWDLLPSSSRPPPRPPD
ncbi:uncharacterized protein LOC132281594 [Cornus florida]|uniref:uncharacterized protein LOC132281594 n=1 Tax=Cornus florida TaxID=4283 RepID=UPI00289EBBDE|nr:uncharacterized protein LOC132281594 [Cornus florida]